ncbi:MAG: hypothetical protein Q7T33_06455, partial [Dehalococcoidia bacterium]|nr:hypothetical protein [Dehalococcoidia bacterium]
APRGLCPTHHVPFVNKRGVSKAKADGTPGKPYDFWACSADVKPWCQEKPADAPARAPEAKAGVVVPAGERVTREQVAVIYAAGAKADRNETQVQMEVAKGFSGRKPEELTPDEAQRVITGYTRHAEAKQAQVPLDTPEKE